MQKLVRRFPRQEEELRRTTRLSLCRNVSAARNSRKKGVTPQRLWLRWYQRLWLRWYWRPMFYSALVRSQTYVGTARAAEVYGRPNQPVDQERVERGPAYCDPVPVIHISAHTLAD